MILLANTIANTIAIAAGAVAIAIVLTGVTVLFLKFRKGSLKIQLDQRSVRPGDIVSGTLCVASKQDLLADRITVSVTCTEHWVTAHTNSDGNATRQDHFSEAYHHEHEIASNVTLAANSRQNLPLQIEIPGHVGYHSVGIDFLWALNARIHIKGLDLSTSQGIRVLYS